MKKYYLPFLTALLFSWQFSLAQPTQPGVPITCNTNNCTPPVSETCSGNSTVITSFSNATLRSGSPTSLPAVYTFYNIATVSGQQINATVTIDAQSNCSMSATNFSIDDDGATDQAGNSITSFFAPRITPSSNLTTTDLRGYVQFTIRFYLENGTAGQQYPQDYTTTPPAGGLSGLNYIHYDIDGSTVGSGGWFRETGVVQNVAGSAINADASTELVSYTYTDGSGWKGFAGSVCERTGVSRCSQVTVAAAYSTPQMLVTFRMGYDYNYNGTSFNSQPTRQYGSRFGCFTFPQLSPLPVKLLSFNGTYKNNTTYLNWVAENQVNFSAYEIERSINGTEFFAIGVKQRQGTGIEKQQYQFTDDLYAVSSDVFFYRLKMIDVDGRFSYSNVVMIRKDGVKAGGLVISPNPVISGATATVRFDSPIKGPVELKVIDLSGKIVLKQHNTVYEGTNSVAIANLDRLLPGMYILQMSNGSTIEMTKLSIAR
ncbi:MAG: T9SS type A sorting domain-containing protein [Chitinophagaceae bacterium]